MRYGKTYVSLKDEDPYTVSRERALELIAAHQQAVANKILHAFPGSAIQILNGRFGPYITDGKKNARLPKGREPASLTLAECEKLLREAPDKKPSSRRSTAKGSPAKSPSGKATTKAATTKAAVSATPAAKAAAAKGAAARAVSAKTPAAKVAVPKRTVRTTASKASSSQG